MSRDLTQSNGEILRGEEVWEEFKELISDHKMSFAEKKVKLSDVMCRVEQFLYQLSVRDLPFNEQLGDIYKISDADWFFIDNKLNLEALHSASTFF